MKYITLEAHEVVGTGAAKTKTLVGTSPEFPIVEKWEDFDELVNSKTATREEIIASFNYGWRVKGQAEIKRNNKTPTNENVKIFKNLTAEQQVELLKKLGVGV